MNRPNIEDYKLKDDGYSQKYITDLEKYCNELEKALDKASKILEEGYGEEYASYIYMKNLDEGIEIASRMNINEWKEWLMNDE